MFCTTSRGFSVLLTTEVVPKSFLNLNVVGHLAVPAGWGSCRLFLFITFLVSIAKTYFWLCCFPVLRSKLCRVFDACIQAKRCKHDCEHSYKSVSIGDRVLGTGILVSVFYKKVLQ